MTFKDFNNYTGRFYNEDCFDAMKEIPDGVVDMILTDPPYGMNYQSNYRKEKYNKIENDNQLSWLDTFSKECFRLSKQNTAHYCFCSFHKIDLFKQSLEKYFTIKNILVWEKNNTSMGDLKGDFAPKHELILFFKKGRREINGSRDSNIFKFNRTGNKLHPTQKPNDMFEYLISKFSDENDLIFDPFAGSGTTAIAAINTNRKWVCIEKEKEYYDKAIDRIWRHEPKR
jgi:site-specific DNA-methyltransferase (adenine-specific)